MNTIMILKENTQTQGNKDGDETFFQLYNIFISFFFIGKLLSRCQHPWESVKCKSSGQPHQWAETGKPKDIHICKNTTTLHSHLTDWPVPSAVRWGDSASLCLANLLQGIVQSWELSMVVLCEEWYDCLSLYSLKSVERESALANRLIGIMSARNT